MATTACGWVQKTHGRERQLLGGGVVRKPEAR